MKKLTIIIFLFLFSCNKNKVETQKEFHCIQNEGYYLIEQIFQNSLKRGLKTTYEDHSCKIYGDNYDISEKLLITLWNLKERKVPLELMLAKAFIESSFRPLIFRYEKHLKYDPYYGILDKKHPLNITDCGLFQVMGFAINPPLKNEFEFTIDRQLETFDSMMNNCLIRANNDIKLAVHLYNTPYARYTENFNSNYTVQVMNKFKKKYSL